MSRVPLTFANLSIMRFLLLWVVALWMGACAGRPLPKYQQPMARASIQRVRTTAYTHTESDHLKHGRMTAAGTQLRSDSIHSAAADWSRWPLGTRFRVRETGEIFQVDDYGWALSGTNTIDLYKPSRAAMNQWGVRTVTLELLEWGSVWGSYRILAPRSKYAHVKRMVRQIDQRYRRNQEGPQPVAEGVGTSMAGSDLANTSPVNVSVVGPVQTGGFRVVHP